VVLNLAIQVQQLAGELQDEQGGGGLAGRVTVWLAAP
jgi:hypothetical protein